MVCKMFNASLFNPRLTKLGRGVMASLRISIRLERDIYRAHGPSGA